MDRAQTERAANGLVILACFAILAWLNGRYVGSGAGQVAAFTAIGLAVAAALTAALAGLVYASAPALRAAGFSGAWDAVARGFLTLVPFALLALLADLAFGWYAATAFMQAAVMTSGAAVGVEVMRRAGPRILHMIAPVAGAFTFAIIWIAYSSIFAGVVG